MLYKGDKMKINFRYVTAFIILLVVEVLIALFVHDNFVRSYIGDILVVILLYTLLRAVISKKIKGLPIYIFIFATFVEFAQYFKIVELLNLQDNKFMSILIGSTFDIKDIICYLVAAIILVAFEKFETSKVRI